MSNAYIKIHPSANSIAPKGATIMGSYRAAKIFARAAWVNGPKEDERIPDWFQRVAGSPGVTASTYTMRWASEPGRWMVLDFHGSTSTLRWASATTTGIAASVFVDAFIWAAEEIDD